MTTVREIATRDVWAAVRGLGMYRMSRMELLALAKEHADNPLFASQVIHSAALQVAATKTPQARGPRGSLGRRITEETTA